MEKMDFLTKFKRKPGATTC